MELAERKQIIEKPTKPHIMETQTPLTEEELANRKRIVHELAELGISNSCFRDMDEYEDPDELAATILIMQGKEVLEELREKLLAKKEKSFDKK